MVTKAGLLVDKLEGIYNRAMGYDTPRSFFLTLFEFVEEYDKNPILEPIGKKIVEMGKEENAPLTELETKALQEMDETKKKIQDYVTEKNITTPVILENLDKLKAFDENRIQSSLGHVKGRHGELSYALMTFAENPEHRGFAKRFGIVDENGRIERWTFSPSYDLWEEKSKYIDRIKLTKLWYSWDKIVFFYQIYKDYEKIRDGMRENNQYLNIMGLNMMFQELNDMMDSKKDPKRYLREFDVITYKVFLERVFGFTKEVLLLTDEELTKQVAKQQWTYDPTLGIFYIDKKIIKLKKNNFRAKLLELLTKTDESKHKTWSWDEIYEEIEGTDEMGTRELLRMLMTNSFSHSMRKR